MAKRREESDGRVVPKGRRKAAPTAEVARGGKATTDNETVGQLRLFFETAASPQGAYAEGAGPSQRESDGVPKSKATRSTNPPAMTMEEVSSEENLRRAFEAVAGNKGAAGPDG